MQIAKKINKYISLVITVLLMGALLFAFITPIHAANTPNRSLKLSNSYAAATNVNYVFRFDIVGNYNLGSIVFEFCSEDPLPNQPCTAPVGFNSLSRTLSNQTGETGFSIDPTSTNSRILLTRASVVNSTNTLSYTFSGITNPSNNGTHFARIYTFNSIDGTGSYVDYGGIAFVTNNRIDFQAEVPPYLYFCGGITITGYDCGTASGLFIDFGEFNPNVTKKGSSQLMAATNAQSGYNIATYGKTMTSGNNTIAALATPTASIRGVSQFGLNLRNNTAPNVGADIASAGVQSIGFVDPDYNIPNRYMFAEGDIIARSLGATNYNKYTASYIVNVSANQNPGVYNTTLTYICLANF